jgi:hypothetical protein
LLLLLCLLLCLLLSVSADLLSLLLLLPPRPPRQPTPWRPRAGSLRHHGMQPDHHSATAAQPDYTSLTQHTAQHSQTAAARRSASRQPPAMRFPSLHFVKALQWTRRNSLMTMVKELDVNHKYCLRCRRRAATERSAAGRLQDVRRGSQQLSESMTPKRDSCATTEGKRRRKTRKRKRIASSSALRSPRVRVQVRR